MPVPVQTTFTASIANGVSTSFPYAFKITDADDLEVSVDGVVITTGFTVTGVGDELGGSVDFTVAPTNGAKVLRALSPILKRETDYQQFGDWSSAEVDADFDRIWLALQALSQNTSRSLKLPKDTADDQVLTEDAAARTGMLVSFDASGNMTLVASADVSLTTVSAFASTLLDDADAAAARATLGAIGASDAVSFASSVALAADISPAQITANQNDYNPTGLSTASVLRLNTDASRDITGLQGGADGRLIVITNVGSFAIVLKDESASSTAANRFALAADITLATDQSVVLQYDSTSSRWRAVAVPSAAASAQSIPVRQTVLDGPVTAAGLPNFGGATGSTTVTATGTLTATAALGANSSGAADYVGQITNPSWTGLSTNGTMYLYLDITSTGVVTTGSTTLAPVYQWGGTYSTTNLQNTFNIQEMTMKVGNGATASQVYRVFVGEVTVAGAVVTAITWYALRGQYRAPAGTHPTAGATTSFNHNLGTDFPLTAWNIKCGTADLGYAVGDVVTLAHSHTYSTTNQTASMADRLTAKYLIYGATSIVRKDLTNFGAITPANWDIYVTVTRGW